MTPRQMTLVAHLDQTNAAVAEVFANLDAPQLAVVRRVRENIDAAAEGLECRRMAVAFKAASMAISRALAELEVTQELADAE